MIRFSMTGSAKASVFPEPVLARPMRSRPAWAGSKTCFWMGNSDRMLRFSSAAMVSSESPQFTSCGAATPFSMHDSSLLGRSRSMYRAALHDYTPSSGFSIFDIPSGYTKHAAQAVHVLVLSVQLFKRHRMQLAQQ